MCLREPCPMKPRASDNTLLYLNREFKYFKK